MDRKSIAWYSHLSLSVITVGVIVSSLLSGPYSIQQAVLEFAVPTLLLLVLLHLWYFRCELAEIRQEWVERRP